LASAERPLSVETVLESPEVVDARVTPKGSLDNLSQAEMAKLLDSRGPIFELFRKCALAVLNSGSETDNAKAVFERYRDFGIRIIRQAWGIKLEIHNAPASAFVDGQMIRGIKEHLFAVLRDVVYTAHEVTDSGRFDLQDPASITDAVFHILRNARILDVKGRPNLVVCWGGHSISREEYDYTKRVGYELGLRGLDVCTGCGPGAMKGPMKGATIGHQKQRIGGGRYLGITEPGIIAAEPPNAMVSHLVIMPDIEKRLEAFVRLGHGIVVFPGGAGTTEELLYLLGVLLDPRNAEQPLPLIITGPKESASYFEQFQAFIGATLGPAALKRYRVIVADQAAVARELARGLDEVRAWRKRSSDSYNFNWLLHVPPELQKPFEVNHETMRSLVLKADQPVHVLAANLRRLFSGIVAGNVKEYGIRAIERFGPFEVHGDRAIVGALDKLLASFVAEHRMQITSGQYHPCYRLVA
jgi:predicted Rossmann-fold nucleotide-binding protein